MVDLQHGCISGLFECSHLDLTKVIQTIDIRLQLSDSQLRRDLSGKYEEECLLFASIFSNNYTEICDDRKRKLKDYLSKEIEKLKNKLSNLHGFDEIEWEVNNHINSRVKLYKSWIEKSNLSDLKEGTDSYVKEKEKIDRYKAQVSRLESCKVETCVTE